MKAKTFFQIFVFALGIVFITFSFFKLPVKGETDVLVLVDNDNPVDRDFTPAIRSFNGFYVATAVYEPLSEMVEAAKNDGVYLSTHQAYRSVKSQEKVFNNNVKMLMKKGMNEDEAKLETAKTVLLPRYSEHHTGLAIDFADSQNDDAMWKWLEENSYLYGFIHRYSKDKEAITERVSEVSHYRYVGKKVASIMHQEKICLEEYHKKYMKEEK